MFQQGRIELVEDFPTFDHTGDGRIDDNDLLFAVTLRSGKPTQSLELPDTNNTHLAGFVQDDWSVSNRLQLNLGLRYEIDTDVNNQSRVDELNPIVQPFVTGERQRDLNNVSPRVGFAWNLGTRSNLLLRGGYGIYYDRVVLQIQTLERGLDGRALPIEVRAGNVFFLDPNTGRLPPFAPTLSNPFTGFILPGAGASGINIIDPHLQNPTVHEFHLGLEARVRGTNLRVDGIHNQGVNFLIGRTVGEVFNPVVGGPDRVVNIESSARTKYDALLLVGRSSVRRRALLQGRLHARKGVQLRERRSDSVPQRPDRSHRSATRVRPDAERSSSPPRRHRSGARRRRGVSRRAVDDVVRRADGHHDAGRSDAHPDAAAQCRRTAVSHGRRSSTRSSRRPMRRAASTACCCRSCRTAHASPTASTRSTSVSRGTFTAGTHVRIEPMIEVFNLFNTTNILGVSNVNYSGFANVLVRDSEQTGTPGYLRSSRFGQPVTTAGGVFGSGGPRAMQLAARVTF